MSKNETINVYWAPYFQDQNSDWNILYPNPKNLFSEMMSKKNTKGSDTFFACPAVQNFMKNIYILNNTIECEYSYDFTNNKNIVEPLSSQRLAHNIQRSPSITDGPLIVFNMSYVFFAEESLITTFSSPYFSKSEYTRYGSLVPGEFDIGKWFRPYICELQLWSNSGSIKFEHEDPLVYVKFNTEKNVNLQRFDINDKLLSIIKTNISTQHWYKTKRSLDTYYYLFNRSRLKNIVLKEIKQNLVSEKI